MDLVDILAKEMKFWPLNLSGNISEYVAQDRDGCLVRIDEGCLPCESHFKSHFNGHGEWSREFWTGNGVTYSLADNHSHSFITREQWQAAVNARNSPTWNGEGLPPVRVDCEAKVQGGNGDWREYKVLAATADYLIVLDGEEETPIRHKYWEFRPIRTAEQIAVDQKLQEIQELMVILGEVPSADYKIIAEAIQKAGYRKQASE